MTTQNQTIDWEAEILTRREWMVGLARFRVSDAHAAEDIVQEVILSIVRQNPTLEDPSKIRAWLYQAIVRRTADHMRHSYRRNRVADELSQTAPIQHEEDGLDWILAGEQQRHLRQAIHSLSQEDREIILLKFTRDWSYKQLGEKLGIDSRAVEYRLVCAKRRLRSELKRLNGGEYV